ncbi:MAG: hypothetical protein CM1200mP2_41720 [Planctomycetaceae bacterium]|nr:MAG: hypothetical protein CM1200mP2_41720 [Planctomycetaceae bacterium]
MLTELLEHIDDEDFRGDYESLLEQYVVESTGTWTIVDEGAVVHDSGRIVASYIGRAAALRGVTIVENSCVISDEEQPTWISDAAWCTDRSCSGEPDHHAGDRAGLGDRRALHD